MQVLKTIMLGGSRDGCKHLELAGDKDDNKAKNERKRIATELVQEGVE